MTRASISIGGVETQANLNFTINTLCQLSNVGNGGENAYLWQILDQPPGTSDNLNNPSALNPTFTPRKEGTYRIALTVNLGQADEARTTALVGIRQIKTGTRIPAAGEQGEAGSRGHATNANELLQLIDKVRADPGIMVAQAVSTLTRNTIVRYPGLATLKTGLPGQESILTCDVAQANAAYITVDPLAIVLGGIDGLGNSVPSGQLALLRTMGLVTNCGLSGSAQALVYASNTGALSLVPGSNSRVVGKLLTSSQDLLFWGYRTV